MCRSADDRKAALRRSLLSDLDLQKTVGPRLIGCSAYRKRRGPQSLSAQDKVPPLVAGPAAVALRIDLNLQFHIGQVLLGLGSTFYRFICRLLEAMVFLRGKAQSRTDQPHFAILNACFQ